MNLLDELYTKQQEYLVLKNTKQQETEFLDIELQKNKKYINEILITNFEWENGVNPKDICDDYLNRYQYAMNICPETSYEGGFAYKKLSQEQENLCLMTPLEKESFKLYFYEN